MIGFCWRTGAFDPNPSFANDRYRKAHVPIHFEYIEQAVICSLSALFGYGGQTSGEVLQNRLAESPSRSGAHFERFYPFCSVPSIRTQLFDRAELVRAGNGQSDPELPGLTRL